jgi:hypothetical protein
MIQQMPDFNNPIGQIWADVKDIIYNSNVELIAKSNVFTDQNNGIDVVSKMLWWLVLNPKNTNNTTPESPTIGTW